MNGSSSYWQKRLAEAEPCHFLPYGNGAAGDKRALAVDVKLSQLSKLQELARGNDGDLESVLHTAWALVLHCYTGLDDVCFGYSEIKRDALDTGSLNAEDDFLSMPVVRLSFEGSARLNESVELAKEAYSYGMQRQRSMQERSSTTLYQPAQHLFNTTMFLEKRQHASKLDQTIDLSSVPSIGTSAGVSIGPLYH